MNRVTETSCGGRDAATVTPLRRCSDGAGATPGLPRHIYPFSTHGKISRSSPRTVGGREFSPAGRLRTVFAVPDEPVTAIEVGRRGQRVIPSAPETRSAIRAVPVSYGVAVGGA